MIFKRKLKDKGIKARGRVGFTFFTADGHVDQFTLKTGLVPAEIKSQIDPGYTMSQDSSVVLTRDINMGQFVEITAPDLVRLNNKITTLLYDVNRIYQLLNPRETFHTYFVITDSNYGDEKYLEFNVDFINRLNTDSKFEHSVHGFFILNAQQYLCEILCDNYKPNGSFHAKVRCTRLTFRNMKDELIQILYLLRSTITTSLRGDERDINIGRMNIIGEDKNSSKLCITLDK